MAGPWDKPPCYEKQLTLEVLEEELSQVKTSFDSTSFSTAALLESYQTFPWSQILIDINE